MPLSMSMGLHYCGFGRKGVPLSLYFSLRITTFAFYRGKALKMNRCTFLRIKALGFFNVAKVHELQNISTKRRTSLLGIF